MSNKSSKSVQILSIELHIIVPRPLYPEGVDCARGSLIYCKAVGEINYFVFCPMNDQYC